MGVGAHQRSLCASVSVHVGVKVRAELCGKPLMGNEEWNRSHSVNSPDHQRGRKMGACHNV